MPVSPRSFLHAGRQACSRVVTQYLRLYARLSYPRAQRRPARERQDMPVRHLLGGGDAFEDVACLYRELFPAAVADTLARADRICDHVFDLLGSGPVRLSPAGPPYQPLDWHSDFKSGHRWQPGVFHRDIRYGPGAGVDIKVPWELSRFQHLHRLGQAHVLTRSPQYLEEFVHEIDDWLAHNPPGFGVNWVSPMDVALRAANWLVAAEYFRADHAPDDGFLQRFHASLHAHARHIHRHLERGGAETNNHFLADLVGLLYLVVYCPFFKESRRWRDLCLRELADQMDHQVYADGCHFEASTCYHRLALELFFFATLLVTGHERRPQRESYRQAAESTFGAAYVDKLYRMFVVVRHLLKPDGRMPQIGDNDSARLHELGAREVLDMRYLLTLGAIFFAEPQFKVREFGFQEEALWVFGRRGYELWQGLHESSVAAIPSRSFPNAGWHVLRRAGDYCLVSCGPNGAGGKGGHAHNDKLSFELVLAGHEVIVDPGTYVYTPDPGRRNRFRSTKGHNTVSAGCEQNELSEDVFRLSDRVKVRAAQLLETDDRIGFGGEIEYAGIVHGRTISLDKASGRWRIEDRVRCPRPRGGEVRFHLSPQVVSHGTSIFAKRRGTLLASLETDAGRVETHPCHYSPAYGVCVPASCISIQVPDVTRAAIVTTIVCWHDAARDGGIGDLKVKEPSLEAP
jgi:uncharacterized heparinase superfamily protein